LQALNAEQIESWLEWSQREPFGFPIVDLLAAAIQATIANAAGAKPPLGAKDFALSERLAELSIENAGGEPVAEGGASVESMILQLEKLLGANRPPPPPQLLGADGKPVKK
jgi:hypothetical protein